MYVHQTIEYDNNLPGRIRLFDSPDGKAPVEAHWHDEIELIYVDSGTLFVTVNDAEHELKRGDVFVLGAKAIHSMTGWEARYLSVHFSDLFVRSYFDAIGDYDFELHENTQERREMTLLMQKLLAIEQNAFDEYSVLAKYSLMIKMLRLLLTRCRTEKATRAVISGKRNHESDAQLVKQYIEENFRRKLFIGEIAELINIAPMYITPYFKKLTGRNFSGYLNEVRVNHALDDYLTHDIAVGDAAIKNGFGHYNHFTSACRKYYGASPTEIKKRKRQRDVASGAPLERSA